MIDRMSLFQNLLWKDKCFPPLCKTWTTNQYESTKFQLEPMSLLGLLADHGWPWNGYTTKKKSHTSLDADCNLAAKEPPWTNLPVYILSGSWTMSSLVRITYRKARDTRRMARIEVRVQWTSQMLLSKGMPTVKWPDLEGVWELVTANKKDGCCAWRTVLTNKNILMI